MAVSPITVQTLAQELPVNTPISLVPLFSTLSSAGLPITEYMVSDSGPGAILLNGATNLATAAQAAQGEVVVSAADLAKLTLSATASSGIVDLYVSASDGVNWSVATGEALSITTNPNSVSPKPSIVLQAGAIIPATSLLTTFGPLNPNPAAVGYTFALGTGNGTIFANGARNMSDFPGTFWVAGNEANFLTYQAPTTVGTYLIALEVYPGIDNGPWSDWQNAYITVVGPAVSAATEIQNAAQGKPLYAAYISDSAANVFANLDALQANLTAGILYGVAVTDTTAPVEQVSAAQFAQDRGVLALTSGAYSLSVTGMSAAQAIGLIAPSSIPHLGSITVLDSAATIAADLDALQGAIAADHLAVISLTDAGTPVFSLSLAQLTKDAGAIGLLSGSFEIAVSASASSLPGSLDALQALAAKGDLSMVTLTDAGTPTLSLSAAQLSADAGALKALAGAFTLTVAAGTAPVSIAGLAGHATTVEFLGDASQYSIAAANGGLTVSGGGTIDTLANVAALQFADQTAIVAQTPGSNGVVTTGNITELYAAVLAREPDAAGLAYYQNYLQSNRSVPLLQFAEWFLSSSEYTGNPLHNYVQTTAGDANFISDSYQYLLHRAPTAAEVSFYQTNVMAPALANLTPGSQAYSAAEFQAHAQMLVYFSSSPEFLADVQVTAQNPVSAQHWLILT